MTQSLQNRREFILFLSKTFDITPGEASYLSWKTGLEKDFNDFATFISSGISLDNFDLVVKVMKEESSKFQKFLDELQNRKETGKSFRNT
jgi:hypothetical protein